MVTFYYGTFRSYTNINGTIGRDWSAVKHTCPSCKEPVCSSQYLHKVADNHLWLQFPGTPLSSSGLCWPLYARAAHAYTWAHACTHTQMNLWTKLNLRNTQWAPIFLPCNYLEMAHLGSSLNSSLLLPLLLLAIFSTVFKVSNSRPPFP